MLLVNTCFHDITKTFPYDQNKMYTNLLSTNSIQTGQDKTVLPCFLLSFNSTLFKRNQNAPLFCRISCRVLNLTGTKHNTEINHMFCYVLSFKLYLSGMKCYDIVDTSYMTNRYGN